MKRAVLILLYRKVVLSTFRYNPPTLLWRPKGDSALAKLMPIWIIAGFFVLCAEAVFACRPFSNDDAGTVAPMHLQVELGAEYLKWKNNDKETALTGVLTTGVIWDRLDFAVGVPYSWLKPDEGDNADGIGDLDARFKLRFVDETDNFPALAVTAGVKTDTGDSEKGLGTGKNDFKGNFIMSKSFGRLTLHVNAGYNYTGDIVEEEEYDLVNLGIAGMFAVTDKFCLGAEIFSEIPTNDTGGDSAVDVLLGVMYTVPTDTVLDAGIAFGLTDTAPDYRLIAGLTHVF